MGDNLALEDAAFGKFALLSILSLEVMGLTHDLS